MDKYPEYPVVQNISVLPQTVFARNNNPEQRRCGIPLVTVVAGSRLECFLPAPRRTGPAPPRMEPAGSRETVGKSPQWGARRGRKWDPSTATLRPRAVGRAATVYRGCPADQPWWGGDLRG